MRHRLHLHVLALLAVLAFLGTSACSGGNGDDEGGGGAAQDDVVVVKQGSEPRAELRLGLKAGDTFRSAMTMKMGIAMTVNGQQVPNTATPAVRMVMAGRIEEVSDTGVAAYRYTMEELGVVPAAEVDPAVAAATTQALASMQGLTGTGSVDRRGTAGPATLDTTKVTDPAVKSMLDSVTSQVANLTVPFPEKAVGVGAVWRAKKEAVLNGITTETTTSYTLVARDGDGYELDVTQDVTAAKGDVAIPGLPAGATAEVIRYQLANTGHITGNVGRAIPSKSRVSGGGDIEMRVAEGGGPTQSLLQTLTVDITFEDA